MPSGVGTPGLGLPGLGLPDIAQIGSLVGGLAEGASKAVEAIGAAAGTAIEDVLDHLKPADEPNNDAEFDLAGHHVKVEMGTDGQVKIEVIGADGPPKSYGLSIDEKGVPVISTPEAASAPAAPTAPPSAAEPAEPADPSAPTEPVAPAEPAPGQLSGGMLGARTQREDQPASDRVPTAPHAEPEPDSGAQLAEAGPL